MSDTINIEIVRDVFTNEKAMLDIITSSCDVLKTKYNLADEVNEEALKAFIEAVKLINQANVHLIFKYCESPIEKIFFNSLLYAFLINTPVGLIFTPQTKNAIVDIDNFNTQHRNINDFVSKIYDEGYTKTHLDNFIENDDSMGDEEKSKFEISRVLYAEFELINSFHIALQPVFKKFSLEGKDYRPDAYLWIPSKENIKLIIECDGFDYHSDKNKFTSDRERDRTFQSKGFQVFRYSGSEIFNDPAVTALKLAYHLFDIHSQIFVSDNIEL